MSKPMVRIPESLYEAMNTVTVSAARVHREEKDKTPALRELGDDLAILDAELKREKE